MVNNTKDLIKFLLENYIKKVEVAVDMTLGNGKDAKNILEITEPKKLYCFDIQKIAIENSKKLIGDFENIKFILDSHTNLDKYISDKIDLAVYNLGYLPTGDKFITTLSEDVILSLKKLLDMLNDEGKIILTFYPGHESGKKESEEVSIYLSTISQKYFSIIKFDFINQKNNPPFVIMISKIK